MRHSPTTLGVVALFACLPASAAGGGEILPGPAEGRTELRFAVAEVSLAPAVLKPGGAAKLEVALSPKPGFIWHEATLRPARAEVVVPEGWTAEPKELALPAAETPAGTREFRVALTPGADVSESMTLVLKLAYGVRPAKAKGSDAAGEVLFEEAKVTVELPALAEPAAPAEAVGSATDPATGSAAGETPRPEPPRPRAGGGSPVLPALFFALAAMLVLGGVAMAIRRARSRR